MSGESTLAQTTRSTCDLRKELVREIAPVTPDSPLRRKFEHENAAKMAETEATGIPAKELRGAPGLSARREGIELIVEESRQ
jgi:hypothetical protein